MSQCGCFFILYLFKTAAAATVFEEHIIRKECMNTNHSKYEEDA